MIYDDPSITLQTSKKLPTCTNRFSYYPTMNHPLAVVKHQLIAMHSVSLMNGTKSYSRYW